MVSMIEQIQETKGLLGKWKDENGKYNNKCNMCCFECGMDHKEKYEECKEKCVDNDLIICHSCKHDGPYGK